MKGTHIFIDVRILPASVPSLIWENDAQIMGHGLEP